MKIGPESGQNVGTAVEMGADDPLALPDLFEAIADVTGLCDVTGVDWFLRLCKGWSE